MKNEHISENKLLLHPDRLYGTHQPITADIFMTNYCNNKCDYCTYKRWELDEGSKYMPYESFVAYAERLLGLGVNGFVLTGGGEPTVNPDFCKITSWLEDNGIHYGVNTNFNLLRYFSPDYLKVSLDAYDESSYCKIRGVNAYHIVREHIIQYAKWRDLHSPNTTIGIQMVVTDPENILRFYESNADLPVDYISFRPIESTCAAYYNQGSRQGDIQECIDAIESLSLMDKRVTVSYKWYMIDGHFEKCYAHWAQIALNESGDVMYCCHKPYQIIGHIMDADIIDKISAAKTDMEACDVPCRMSGPNRLSRYIESAKTDRYFI